MAIVQIFRNSEKEGLWSKYFFHLVNWTYDRFSHVSIHLLRRLFQTTANYNKKKG